MQEAVEFRIPEENANQLFAPHEGRRLGDSVRLVEVVISDPRFPQIGLFQQQMRASTGEPFFYGWQFHRRYSVNEFESAELFHLDITASFEPAGEECGTRYEDSSACSYCGAGRKQTSDLILDLRKAPKAKDIARTIADEWIVSQRFAQLLMDTNMTGFELRPVRHKARYEDDPIDLAKVPSGREILRLAEADGVPHPTWTFWVWLNRPEHAELLQRAIEEQANLRERHDRRRFKPVPVWYQLIVTSAPVPTVVPTRFGIDPFDEDPEGLYRCPLGHVSGLNVLSELWVSRAAWDGSDVAQTANLVGTRRGLLMPPPMLLISPRLWRLLRTEDIKGYTVEVAYVV